MPEKMPEKELKKTTANGAPAVGKSRQKVRKRGCGDDVNRYLYGTSMKMDTGLK